MSKKKRRFDIAREMLTRSFNDDPDLLKTIITDDESWVYGYDIETKAQSYRWKRPEKPRPKKAQQVRSNVKVGMVHHEFLPQGRTVNKEYYLEVMRSIPYIYNYSIYIYSIYI